MKISAKPRKVEPPGNPGFAELLETCGKLKFVPHDISAHLDSRGHYKVRWSEEFPFVITLFHYSSRHHTRGATWHERLELFVPLDGPVRMRNGDQVVQLSRGEILVVDNLKLHNVMDFSGFNTRVIVISFMPEFVYSLGSPSFDYAFLLPFYAKVETRAHLVRLQDPASSDVCSAMARLVKCFFSERDRQYYQAGCKAFLLETLYHMARHFRASELAKWEFLRQQQRSLRLKKIFDHIRDHFAERLSIDQAAALAGMSAPQFMKTFKKVAGMTLVAYINHVRLSNAVSLLKETDHSIAEIASATGFSDQSYFDKRFRRAFGATPREFRSRIAGTEVNPGFRKRPRSA